MARIFERPWLLCAMWIAGGLGLLLATLTDELTLESRQTVSVDPPKGVWTTGCFSAPGVYPTTKGGVLPNGFPFVGSWQNGNEWNGDGATVWQTDFSRTMRVCVAGYPKMPGCRLWAEFRAADNTVTRKECAIENPRETWRPWDFRVPRGTVAMRIAAEDFSTDHGGWLAFSAPLRVKPNALGMAYFAAQLLCAIGLIGGAGLCVVSGFVSHPPGAAPAPAAKTANDSRRSRRLPRWISVVDDHSMMVAARKLVPAGIALTLFLVVLGMKWSTVDRFGSDIPNWDQWDAEGMELLAPWFEGNDFIRHLFHPHNEHRIVLTKLQNLAVTLVAGQWDSRLECIVNAGLHAALAAAFWILGRRWLEARWHAPLFVVLAALFGLPFAWQNVLGGFHSQQYWMLGLSFIAILFLPFARPGSRRWLVGAAAAGLALLTMGSGFFAAAIVFGLVGLRLLRRDTRGRDAWPTLVVALVFVAIGALTRVEVDFHQQLKAKTLQDFVDSIVHSLQWPVPRGFAWEAALILWLPWAIVTWRALRPAPGTDPRRAQIIFALGGWVLLQILATAYARGAGGNFPASRYMDTLGFGMAANALALGWLISRGDANAPAATAGPVPPNRRVWRASLISLATLFGLGWLGVLGWGLHGVNDIAVRDAMPDAINYLRQAEGYTRAYLTTKDRADLLYDNIPYPGADSFIQRLTRPSLVPLLPASVRLPLELKPATSDRGGFTQNHVRLIRLDREPRHGLSAATKPLPSLPTWGSFGAAGAATTGEWRSAPLAAPLGGWLKFETAGQLGEPGVSLELADARTGARLANVQPSKVPGNSWRAAYVRAPREPFVVVARDQDAARWMAFSSPVEMSTLSYWAWRAGKHGADLAQFAAVAAVLLGLFSMLPRKP